jgi:hypothetical protein
MPWQNEMHIDQALTNISCKYVNSGFIADQIFPTVKVAKESDLYWVYDMCHYRIDQDLRANRSEANEVSYAISTSSYSLEERALVDYVSDRDRANADPALQPEIDATENLTQKILLGKEVRCYQLMTTTSFANSMALVTATSWAMNSTTSDPIGNIGSATAVIVGNTGLLPNTVAMGYRAFSALKNHVNILERIKYTSMNVLTTGLLASLFDVERVLVGSAVRDTAQEGLAQALSPVWTPDGTQTNVFVGYVEKSPSLRRPSAGYHLQISYQGGPFKVKKWREEKRASDAIEVSTMDRVYPIATNCAYLIRHALIT